MSLTPCRNRQIAAQHHRLRAWSGGAVDAVTDMAKASLHSSGYVGEWHSHPQDRPCYRVKSMLASYPGLPSELEAKAFPALMAIAGDDGTFSFLLLDDSRQIVAIARTGPESVMSKAEAVCYRTSELVRRAGRNWRFS